MNDASKVSAALHLDQEPPSETAFTDALETLRSGDENGFETMLQKLSCGVSKQRGQMEMIRDILIAYPSFVSTPRTSDGALPLHIAAKIGNVQLGCLLAVAYPAASALQTKKGKTPLHITAREGHGNFVAMLLRLNPYSAQINTKKLKLPLHFAAAEGQAEICCQLLAVYPEGAEQRSTNGKLPLHLASRRGYMETMQALLSVYPEGMESLDWESATPLNLAVREKEENAAIHLIDKCPHALQMRNIIGQLPLDIAIRNTLSLRLFSKMVKTWPESCQSVLMNVKREENVSSWDWSKIELCLQAVSGLFRTGTDESRDIVFREYLPLHIISELTSNDSLIQRVLRTCPDLVSSRDQLGRLPLHIAVDRCENISGEYVEQLLKLHPMAAVERDSLGRLPLHIALANKCDLSTVELLLSANPKSAVQDCGVVEARLSDVPPLFLALEYGCSTDIIYILIRFNLNLFSFDKNQQHFVNH